MNASLPLRQIRVHLLALLESTASVLYGLYDVLTSVGVVWPMLTGRASAPVRFDVRIVAEGGEPFACIGGLPVAPHCALGQSGPADAVVVTDLMLPFDADPRGRWPEAAAWLRRQHADGALVTSVCTGSILLADAGLLDGLQATTHWAFVPAFARLFPRVRLVPECVLAWAGPDERILTSGGVASWEDLVLYLIARYCGREEAIHTAKVFLIGDRSAGQLAFSAMPKPPPHEDAAIAKSQRWVADHYAESGAVARMAERSGLAPRTFKRRFRAATGYAPIAYVQTLRIEEAKQLLETTESATDAVGELVGYEDPASFRRLFKRETGLTPSQYRRRFRHVGEAKEETRSSIGRAAKRHPDRLHH